jgi:hypothetical protein
MGTPIVHTNQRLERGIVLPDLRVEGAPSAGQRTQRRLGEGRRRRHGARPHRRQHPHQGHPRGDADKLFAQSLRRVDEQRLERHHCLSSRFERRVAGDLEVTDHLYFTITGIRQIVSFSRQNRTGGRFRVNDVGHAELAPELAPRASDFDGAAPACDERTAETGAIRTGSLAAKGMHGSMDPD